MKVFIALLCLVAVPMTLAQYDWRGLNKILRQYESSCGKKSGLDSAQIEKIRESGRLTPLPENNELVNQWAKCMLQKFQIINDDGTVNTDVNGFFVWDDASTYRIAFPICKNKTGKDSADTARLMWDCYRFNSSMEMMAVNIPCHAC